MANTEQHWSCGCVKIDGKLERECTQVKPYGEMSSTQAATAKPYSPECFRRRQERDESGNNPQGGSDVVQGN